MKSTTVLIAALFALAAPVVSFAAMDHGSMKVVAAPVLADEVPQHGASNQAMDDQCAKECAMLLKNCAQEVDSIQDRISKLQVEINEKGADTYTRDELRILAGKLKEANETLRALLKPGR